MECAWISNFVILETEALLTFCQEEHGVGSERARAGAGLKAGFLRQKNIRTKSNPYVLLSSLFIRFATVLSQEGDQHAGCHG